MESIFGVAWEELELDYVRAFLDTAGDEGILWEAKATDPRREDARIEASLIREPICGLANSIGGYVIVGAVRDAETKEWSLPGVIFPHDEPKTWLDDVAETLRPRPKTDSKAWKIEDNRVVAVVQVEPVAVPPCMNAGGQIFERTSGKTVRVTDPLVLARLTERGQVARKAAEAGARRVAELVSKGSLRSDNRGLIVTIGVRASGYESDIASRLFRESTADGLTEIVAEHLKKDRRTANTAGSVNLQVQQDRLSAFTTHGALIDTPDGGDRVWQVAAIWDGAVGIRCEGNDREIGIEILFDDVIVPALRAASKIITLLGGYGSAHLVLTVGTTINTGREDWPTGNVPGGPIERELDAVDGDDALTESLKREVLRSMHYPAWEPEEAPTEEPET
jgi:Schlafen, AlbA_2